MKLKVKGRCGQMKLTRKGKAGGSCQSGVSVEGSGWDAAGEDANDLVTAVPMAKGAAGMRQAKTRTSRG